MPSESHFELRNSYPKKPLWAATLAFCFGPLGTVYTSVILSIAYFLIVFLLINIASLISFSFQLIAFPLSITFSIVVYRYSLQPPNLTHILWLDRFDRPGWIKCSLLILAQVLLALVLVFFIRTVISTRGISMLPTLAPGERVTLNILPILRGPIVRGTVVRYHLPGRPYQSISRVVALEGDTVEMKRGLIYVNSRAADNPLLVSKLRAAGCIDEKMASSNTAVVGSSPERPETELRGCLRPYMGVIVAPNRNSCEQSVEQNTAHRQVNKAL